MNLWIDMLDITTSPIFWLDYPLRLRKNIKSHTFTKSEDWKSVNFGKHSSIGNAGNQHLMSAFYTPTLYLHISHTSSHSILTTTSEIWGALFPTLKMRELSISKTLPKVKQLINEMLRLKIRCMGTIWIFMEKINK